MPSYHPSSNGAAERTVQILKQALQKEAERVRRGAPKRVFETRTRKLSVPVQKHSSFCCRGDTSRTVLKAQTSHQFSVLKPNMEMHIQNQQGKQQQEYDTSRVKMCELSSREDAKYPGKGREVGS